MGNGDGSDRDGGGDDGGGWTHCSRAYLVMTHIRQPLVRCKIIHILAYLVYTGPPSPPPPLLQFPIVHFFGMCTFMLAAHEFIRRFVFFYSFHSGIFVRALFFLCAKRMIRFCEKNERNHIDRTCSWLWTLPEFRRDWQCFIMNIHIVSICVYLCVHFSLFTSQAICHFILNNWCSVDVVRCTPMTIVTAFFSSLCCIYHAEQLGLQLCFLSLSAPLSLFCFRSLSSLL